MGVLEGGTVALCGWLEVWGWLEGGSVMGGGKFVVVCGV